MFNNSIKKHVSLFNHNIEIVHGISFGKNMV